MKLGGEFLDVQVNFRCEKELKLILMKMDNYSDWIRSALLEQLEKEQNEDFINLKVKECQDKLDFWKKKKTGSKQDSIMLDERISYWKREFNQKERYKLDSHTNFLWAKSHVYPDLKKHGFKGKPLDVLNLICGDKDV